MSRVISAADRDELARRLKLLGDDAERIPLEDILNDMYSGANELCGGCAEHRTEIMQTLKSAKKGVKKI